MPIARAVTGAALSFTALVLHAAPTETLTFRMNFQGIDYLNGTLVGAPFTDKIQLSFPFVAVPTGQLCFYTANELCLGNAARDSGSVITSSVAGGLWDTAYMNMLAYLGVPNPSFSDRQNITMADRVLRSEPWLAATPYELQFYNTNFERFTNPVVGGTQHIFRRTFLNSYAYTSDPNVDTPTLADLNSLLLEINANTWNQQFSGYHPWRLDFEVRADLLLSDSTWGPMLYDVDYVGFGTLEKIEIDGNVIYDAAIAVPVPSSIALIIPGLLILGFRFRVR